MTIDQWKGCYPSNWKGVIVPEAMSHPAKYSSKLIRRIYEHMIAEGWVKEGDRVLDPFGGVALGAWDATRLGLHYTGIELELKFFRLGSGLDCPGFDKAYWKRYHTRGRKWNELNICPDCGNLLDGNGITIELFGTYQRLIPTQSAHRYHGNIENWEIEYSHLKGTARLLHGDSRRLLSVIGDAVQVSVSSPPYADSDQNYREGWKRFHDGHEPLHKNDIQREAEYGTTDGQLSAMPANQFDAAISSPPYTDSMEKKGGIDPTKSNHKGGPNSQMNNSDTRYGVSDGQLGAMKSAGFDAVISSPPFLQSEGGTPEPKPGGAIDAALYARHAAGNAKANGYGESDGQLSSMKDGGFEAAVSSPPFSQPNAQMIAGHQNVRSDDYRPEAEWSESNLASMPADEFAAAVSSPPFEDVNAVNDPKYTVNRTNGGGPLHGDYGNSAGQLGNDSGADFWLAARQIVEQVYLALTPGGHAVWVVKNYVKAKKIVNFCDQWRQLCEAVGFQTLHEHHAMLVHHKGTQHTLEGGTVEKITESKSFFRRIAEKNGSPRIDYEVVYCMVKS